VIGIIQGRIRAYGDIGHADTGELVVARPGIRAAEQTRRTQCQTNPLRDYMVILANSQVTHDIEGRIFAAGEVQVARVVLENHVSPIIGNMQK